MRETKFAKKCVLAITILLMSVLTLTACNATKQYFVYGTFLEVTTKGQGSSKLVGTIASYIESLESILSPTVEGSDIYKINKAVEGEPVVCKSVTMDILKIAEYVCDVSKGAYDPSIYPLVRLWKFAGDLFTMPGVEVTPPTDDEIEETLTLIGLKKAFSIDYQLCTVTKRVGFSKAMLDFGGVAKGYAVDKAKNFANEKQKVLINLGGNICAKNQAYTIGIGNPRSASTAYFGDLNLFSNECISTSGDYEKYYSTKVVDEVTGAETVTLYHHILSPLTGRPSDNTSENGLISVSVITENGALGDAVATAVMVLGKEKGTELLIRLGLKAILIDANLHFTKIGNFEFNKQ